MSTTATTQNPHILIFPYPALGHMLSLLDLTHRLALHNLAITVVITPKNLPFLSPLLSSHPSITPLVLPFPSRPSIPAGVENVKDLGNSGNVLIMSALTNLHTPLINWFRSHPTPPVAIISDFFLGATHRLAAELKIPRVAFYSSGAFYSSVADYLWNDVDKFKSVKEFRFEGIPGSPAFKAEHFPSLFRNYRKSDPDSEFIRDGMIENSLSSASIYNSFDALEGKYLEHLKKKRGQNRVFGVGPLSFTGLDSSARGLGNSDPSCDNRVLNFLNGCPDGSVVYVCFGSQKLLNKEQMEALASGLEKSGTRFIWVVKPATSAQQKEAWYGSVTDGLENRVGDRGIVIIGWAPQVVILKHKAVGGFLSHCGWNSTLEAITSGVMILAWPMEADQFQDAWLLVEDLGVGVRVCEGAYSVPDPEELGRVINVSMREGGGVKLKAKELSKEAFAAVGDGGSSTRDLEGLVKELRQLQSN